MANRDKRTNFGLYISFHRTKQIRSIIHQLGLNATLIKIKKNVHDAVQRVCLSTIVTCISANTQIHIFEKLYFTF
jgi:hypothetical protein